MGLIDHPWVLFAVLLVVLLAVLEIGFRLRSFASAKVDEERHSQIEAARDGLGVLLSLLLGFMLPLALPHYDQRKQLIVDEANAIGTTSLRAQMLPEPARSKIQGLLREYVDVRIEYLAAELEEENLRASLNHAKQLQSEIWLQGVEIAQQNPTVITSLFVQSLNETIDLSEKRLAALEYRIPSAIWLMLVLISLLTCLVVGYSMPRRILLAMIVTPLMVAIVLGLVADLDAPRTGLIRVEHRSMERLQMDLKAGTAKP